jgi:hypothetical protein
VIFTTYIATSGGKDRLAAATGTIPQSVETIRQEPLDPLAHMLLCQVNQPGDLDQWEPVSDPEDRPVSPGGAEGGGRTAEALLQVLAFLLRQDHAQRRLAASHRCLLD